MIFKKYKSSLYFEVMLKEAMNFLKQILAPRRPPKWLKRTKSTWIENLIYAIVSKFELNSKRFEFEPLKLQTLV